jgi:hypothetical protein
MRTELERPLNLSESSPVRVTRLSQFCSEIPHSVPESESSGQVAGDALACPALTRTGSESR